MQEGYKRFDLSKLNMSHKIISMEEALKDVTPMVFNEEVYNGTKKVKIDKQGIHYV